MAIALRRADEHFYALGVPGLPALCWYRDEDGGWRSRPEEVPKGAEAVTLTELPDDLREELLAFVTRAEAMGPSRWDTGN